MTDGPENGQEIGRTPIQGGEPAGKDIRYEADFEIVQAELAKMEVDGPNAVNWSMLQRESQRLLTERSKDLLIGAYYTLACFHNDGLAGLANGLQAMTGMVETHWEGLFPPLKRERARAGAVDWLAERLGGRVQEIKLNAALEADAITARAAFDAMEALLEAKLVKSSTNLGELRRPLRSLAQEAERAQSARNEQKERDAAQPAAAEKSAKPAGTEAAQQHSAAARSAELSPPDREATPAEFNKAMSGLQRSIRQFAEVTRARDLADIRGFALTRQAAWLPISRPPPEEAGKTALPDPGTEIRSGLEQLWQSKNYRGTVEASERALTNAPFWLDPHRYCAYALAALGADFTPAKLLVVAELAAWLRRFPELLALHFQDGAAFADEQTRSWIADEIKSGSGGEAAQTDGEAEPWAETFRDAQAMARSGKKAESLAMLVAGRRQAGHGRARFLWGVNEARLCLENGMVRIAVPLLEQLCDEAERLSLQDWEPDLLIEAASLLIRCYSGEGKKLLGGDTGRVTQLYRQVACLDASLALSLAT